MLKTSDARFLKTTIKPLSNNYSPIWYRKHYLILFMMGVWWCNGVSLLWWSQNLPVKTKSAPQKKKSFGFCPSGLRQHAIHY